MNSKIYKAYAEMISDQKSRLAQIETVVPKKNKKGRYQTAAANKSPKKVN